MLTVNGVIGLDLDLLRYATGPESWLLNGAAFAGFAAVAVAISGAIHGKMHLLVRSEVARSQMLKVSNARLAEANERLREVNEQLETRIAERTRRLEQANRELESFSYTVSHDLRSPLQVIEGFSGLALQEDAAAIPAKTRDYLHRIQGGARRMHAMIGQLLKFSELANAQLQLERVSLSAIAESVLADLSVTQPDRRVAISIEPGLEADADPALIQNVLHNLLANAWKFTSQVQAARIEFGHRQNGERSVYFVRDNGAGFDTEKAQRLFQPFVRLHDKRDFQGSGVGLATAKRIIERHGGRIWAESVPGQGAAFFFTLG